MKKRTKMLISIVFVAIISLISSKNVQAKSYSIEDMDIQATVEQDGSVNIKQEITYQFKGSYNGIYINIPYNLDDAEYKEVNSKSTLGDSFYNASNVKINNVSLINNGGERVFTQVDKAINGSSEVYTARKRKRN